MIIRAERSSSMQEIAGTLGQEPRCCCYPTEIEMPYVSVSVLIQLAKESDPKLVACVATTHTIRNMHQDNKFLNELKASPPSFWNWLEF